MINGKKQYKNPLIATDIIIEYDDGKKNGIVLIERKNPPYGLALPGGFAEYGLSLEENAIKEAKEETGLEIIIENPEHPLCVFSEPKRDSRGHIISTTYIGKAISGSLIAGDDAKRADIYPINELKELMGKNKFAFDHEKIVKEYLQYRGYL